MKRIDVTSFSLPSEHIDSSLLVPTATLAELVRTQMRWYEPSPVLPWGVAPDVLDSKSGPLFSRWVLFQLLC